MALSVTHMPPIADLRLLLQSMEPRLNPGIFVFSSLPPGRVLDPTWIIAAIREPEGLSVVVEESVAAREYLEVAFRCAWITLTVNSALEAVGLTAAFASALGKAGISCNVVAGTQHDHIFVPVHLATKAMNELGALQGEARSHRSDPSEV